jgi:hypothetical protein
MALLIETYDPQSIWALPFCPGIPVSISLQKWTAKRIERRCPKKSEFAARNSGD